jgi:hypothetical protein
MGRDPGHARSVATTGIEIDVHPDAVWAVLADPTTYPRWLVGTKAVLAVDRDFPLAGSSFRHQVGVGPLRIRDVTTAIGCDVPARRLVLEARARPLIGSARVEMVVDAIGGDRSRVTIDEDPRSIPLGPVLRPLADRMVKVRNKRSLAALRRLLEVPDPLREVPERATGPGVAARALRRTRPVGALA